MLKQILHKVTVTKYNKYEYLERNKIKVKEIKWKWNEIYDKKLGKVGVTH